MTLYEQFKKAKLDLTLLGLENGPARSDYFCTPIGAKVIGWAGVDGIHFCFIRGFDDMVFSVSPMNGYGDYVHPVARSFADFLRLLLACGNTAAIEQAHGWNEEEFATFLAEDLPDAQQTAVLEQLRDTFALQPIESPFAQIKALQAEFDDRALRFKKEYFDGAPEEPLVPTEPEWKVYYHSGFFSRCGREHCGTEIPVGKVFSWDDELWHIPAVYACTSGLVVDYCVEVPLERVYAYTDKWSNQESLSKKQVRQMTQENPLCFSFESEVCVNGHTMNSEFGNGQCWDPTLLETDGFNDEAKWIMEHYGLDEQKAWRFHRITYPWATRRKPKISEMRVTLTASPVYLPATKIHTPTVGETVLLSHPLTGKEYILTAEEVEQTKLDDDAFSDDTMEYPTHFTQMVYTLTPPTEDSHFQIADCADGDSPRAKVQNEWNLFSPTATSCVMVCGITAGVRASTSQMQEKQYRVACSSLHFEPVDDVEWSIGFRENLREDVTIQLI